MVLKISVIKYKFYKYLIILLGNYFIEIENVLFLQINIFLLKNPLIT